MRIPSVPDAQKILDIALLASKKAAGSRRGNMPGKTRRTKSTTIEYERVVTIKQHIVKQLGVILRNYPSLDTLPEYQRELLYLQLDYPALKKSLGAVKWAETKVHAFAKEYTTRIKKTTELDQINAIRREFTGRASSALKQINPSLVLLEKARIILEEFPELDLSLPIVCIAGFPNVGKSTLLKKITGSNVKIADYAFTTTSMNVGKLHYRNQTIQFVDTPGTLNRKNRNPVEDQAHIALKFLSQFVIFVVDPIPSSGYTLEDQLHLLEKTKRYRKPIICYVSKTDICSSEQLNDVQKELTEHDVYLTSQDIEKVLIKTLLARKKMERPQ